MLGGYFFTFADGSAPHHGHVSLSLDLTAGPQDHIFWLGWTFSVLPATFYLYPTAILAAVVHSRHVGYISALRDEFLA